MLAGAGRCGRVCWRPDRRLDGRARRRASRACGKTVAKPPRGPTCRLNGMDPCRQATVSHWCSWRWSAAGVRAMRRTAFGDLRSAGLVAEPDPLGDPRIAVQTARAEVVPTSPRMGFPDWTGARIPLSSAARTRRFRFSRVATALKAPIGSITRPGRMPGNFRLYRQSNLRRIVS